jgi:phage FluMu gp28-like protein
MVPWWLVRALCRDVVGAREIAPHMLTEERVRLFGTQRLIEIFDNLPLEDFQQEYECAWIDEAASWITWDEIKRNQMDALAGGLWYRQVKGKDAALAAIDELAQAARDGHIEGVLAGGYDVGRHRNASELVLVGKSHTKHTPYRLGVTLENVEFDDQVAVLCKALDWLPINSLLIDRNGLGMQLAEHIGARYGARAEGIDFTNANKELWAVELKVRMQKAHLPLPLERDLSYQIHSIKKRVTAAKNSVYDTEGNERHHADKFWALALAVWAALGGAVAEVQTGSNPMSGYRG